MEMEWFEPSFGLNHLRRDNDTMASKVPENDETLANEVDQSDDEDIDETGKTDEASAAAGKSKKKRKKKKKNKGQFDASLIDQLVEVTNLCISDRRCGEHLQRS
jgi:hypothetical protein